MRDTYNIVLGIMRTGPLIIVMHRCALKITRKI